MPILREDPFLKRHYAPCFSPATALAAILAVASIGLPYVILAFGSFWPAFGTFVEQPRVAYEGQMVLLLAGTTGAATTPLSIMWSTDANYNANFALSSRVVTLETAEIDVDGDGKNDYLNFNITVPLTSSEQVAHVYAAFSFQYGLSSQLQFQMQSLALLSTSTPSPSPTALYIDGDLALTQRVLLSSSNKLAYDTPALDLTSTAASFTWEALVASYADRDVRTVFNPSTPIWTSGAVSAAPFVFTGRIRYAQTTVTYSPSTAEVVKQVWVEYVVLFAGVAIVLRWVLGSLLRSGAVRTSLRIDRVPRVGAGAKEHVF
ncbi:hypothetical protein HDU87_006957 [Geranomyces variabilis]|uniref:Transmembrane protein 231 n=1 Tax=Geranomyces variabilis TaxID=109894 RepID=A0AAD5XNM8_9FUNG|nr:hypothetical protein HDU87_006957 [Geranomyces variabilis]